MIPDAQQVSEAQQRGGALIQRITSFEMPSRVEYVDSLASMHLALAIILFACGMVYLLQGWKIFKMLVIVNAAILGAFLGGQLGVLLRGGNAPLFAAIAGAMLFAALAWPLMKVAVSLMGALVGGFVGYGMWSYVAEAANKPALAEHAWAGALIGLVALGLLAVIIFRFVVMIFTSVQGSLMTVSGIVAILMKLAILRSKLQPALASNMHLLVLLIGVPAIIGFGMQYTAMSKKAKKKKKAMEGE